jgi:hypothetical protein
MVNVIIGALIDAYSQFNAIASPIASVLFNMVIAANLHYRPLNHRSIDRFSTIAANTSGRHE